MHFGSEAAIALYPGSLAGKKIDGKKNSFSCSFFFAKEPGYEAKVAKVLLYSSGEPHHRRL